jgi:hypothetical protein
MCPVLAIPPLSSLSPLNKPQQKPYLPSYLRTQIPQIPHPQLFNPLMKSFIIPRKYKKKITYTHGSPTRQPPTHLLISKSPHTYIPLNLQQSTYQTPLLYTTIHHIIPFLISLVFLVHIIPFFKNTIELVKHSGRYLIRMIRANVHYNITFAGSQ